MTLISAEAQVITLGYGEYPPYTFTNADGKPDGIYMEIIEHHMQACNLTLVAKGLPPKRLYDYLYQGKVDLFMGIKTQAERKAYTTAGKEKLVSITLKCFYLDKNEETAPQSLTDIKNLRVGFMNGFAYYSAIHDLKKPEYRNSIQIIDQHKSGFEMLKLDRIDCLLNYEQPSQVVFQDMDDSPFDSFVVNSIDCFYIMNNKTPNAQLILDKLDKIIRSEREKRQTISKDP